ncbi:MAG: hypothetical protein OYL41_04145 [Acidobacteriota bacterium]|nr:hypothetical protein [Acidobacteriota bacterium]
MPGTDGLRAAELLAAARLLLEGARDRQDSAHARRAVSTAYYAMFHCLARICVDRLAENRGVPLRPPTRRTVYRSLQHGRAKRRCMNPRVIAPYPRAIQAFARGFAELQKKRHRADYDPSTSFKASQARESVDQAEELIRALQAAPEADLRDFALRVLLAERED